MWEDETIVLVTSLKKRILGGKDSVRFSVISSDKGVPVFVKAKFKERVEKYIAEESPLSLKSTAHFELKPEDLKNLRTRFLDVLRQAARFPKEEIESILRDALILRIDYIVKPVDTMRRLLFKEKDSVSYSVVEENLTPFLEVLSYAEYVLKKCALKRPDSISSEVYSGIVSDLLHSINEQDPLGNVLKDFSVLLNFLSETKSEQITRIDAAMIQDFLADRNLISFRRAVDVEVELGRKDFSAEDLEITIKRYLALKSEFGEKEESETEVQVAEKTQEPEVETAPEPKSEETEKLKQGKDEDWVFDDLGMDTSTESEKEEELTEEPLKTADSETDEVEPVEPEKVVEESPKEPAKPMRIIRRDLKEGEDKAAKDKPSVQEEVQKNTIRSYIDKKAEKSFVKKLFGGSQEDFDKLVGKLDEAESWRVAKILIDNELFKRDVDPFSREAIKLVDMVYGLYYPEESIGGTK
ncbi:hypothetical protein J7K93_03705 [bacterium]|nr:hypothetical protein [bacterium]